MNDRAALVAAIQEAIINPPKDMPSPEEMFYEIFKEELNKELWGDKEGVINTPVV